MVAAAQGGGDARFLLEAALGLFHGATVASQGVGLDEFHRGRSGQQAMLGKPDLAHATFAQLAYQAIRPQLADALLGRLGAGALTSGFRAAAGKVDGEEETCGHADGDGDGHTDQ